jgi:ABC-type amino acid transport system permease subunit
MAQKANKARSAANKSIKPEEKKHLIDPRYKSFVYTVIVVVVLLIFFIVNNTRQEPDHGDYPSNYKAQTTSQQK